jgi:hypothetical protein
MHRFLSRPVRFGVAVCVVLCMLAFGETAKAQDMQTFLFNLNQLTSTAYGHYIAGVNIYNSVPVWQRLDYKCANGDMRACLLHQKQLENAYRYMAYHYRNLGQ